MTGTLKEVCMEMSTSNTKQALSVRHLSKSYSGIIALNDLSFDVSEGELYGIIGPDGAGKTSLFRILTTLLTADKGTATVCGMDVLRDFRKIRKCIGYMPGKFSLYQDLTVEENLDFFATLFGTTRQENYALIEDIYKQIEPFKYRKAGKLSGGMKQKLALSCALIHKPSILFLDEPTTGVDPVSRKEFWEMLLRLKAQNITILVSTPYMDEATLCDHIALIQNGSFMDIDTPQGIITKFPTTLYAVHTDNMHPLLSDLHAYPLISTSFSFGDSFHVTFLPIGNKDLLHLYLQQKGYHEIEIQEIKPSVEDCFMLLSNSKENE
jgi:ABC-type multidrug transport system ATPase subunit